MIYDSSFQGEERENFPFEFMVAGFPINPVSSSDSPNLPIHSVHIPIPFGSYGTPYKGNESARHPEEGKGQDMRDGDASLMRDKVGNDKQVW